MDLSPYYVTGTDNPNKQVSVTRWNNLLTELGTVWPDFTPNSTVMLEAAMPSATNSAGGEDAVPFRVVAKKNGWTNGPVGHTNYTDYSVHFGQNITQTLGRENSALGAFYISWESKFYQDSTFASEWQFRFQKTDGTEYRPLQFFCPHDGTRGKSGASFQIDRITINDQANVEIVNFDVDGKDFGHTGVKFRCSVNNVPTSSQLNAAGNSYVNGPYLTNYDNWYVDRPHYYVGSPPVNDLGIKAGFTSFDTSAVADNRGYYSQGGVITGSYYPFDGVADCTVAVIGRVRNTSATGKAVFDLVGNTASLCEYRVNGTKVLGAQQPANPDTSGATLAALETEVNELKAALRAHGIIAT